MSDSSLQASCVDGRFFSFCDCHLMIACLVLFGMVTQVIAAGPPPRGVNRPSESEAPPTKQTQPLPVPQADEEGFVEEAPTTAYQARPLLEIINANEKNQKFRPADIAAIHQQEFTQILKEDYLAHGSRNEKWDGPLLKAIEETLRCISIAASPPERKALVHMLRLPARYKCDDPRYYYMYVYARNYEASQENLKALETALELAQAKAEHHRHLIWMLGLRLSQMQNRWPSKQALAMASRQQARDIFVQWLEHEVPKYDENLVYDWADYFDEFAEPVVVNEQEEKSIARMMEQIGKLKHVSPWIQAFLEARAARKWAWKVRGPDYAYKVPESAWKVWREKNALAYDMAVKAHDLNPQQALAATELISICWSMDETRGERYASRYWFEQAVAAMIDYQEAYTSYAWGIMPRWHGSLQMELAFAWECALTRRYDTVIPFMATHVLSNFRRDLDDEDSPINHRLATFLNKVLKDVMTGYLEHEKDPMTRKLMQQFWLNWTDWLDLPNEAVKVNALLDNPYDSQLPYYKKYFMETLSPYALNTLLARGEPGGELLTRAINAERYEDSWFLAERLFQKVIEANEATPAGIQYARDRIQSHQWQEAFDAGDWVSLKFDERFTGWKKLAGTWERIDENTIQGTNDDLPMRIAPIIDLGSGYEWEVTLEFIHKAKGPALMAGIVYAYEQHPEYYDQYGHFVRHEPGSLWVHLGGYEPYRIGNTEIPAKVTCTFILKDKRMQTLIKDGEVLKDTWIKANESHLLLAMGTAFTRNPGSIIKYSNIRVRKIAKQAKEAPQNDNQQQDE